MNVGALQVLTGKFIDLVRACGVDPIPLTVDELATLAQPAGGQPDVLIVDQRDRGTIPAEIRLSSACTPRPES